MGAADEGYEEVVVNLLMAIDARRKQAGGGKSVRKQGVGSRRRGNLKASLVQLTLIQGRTHRKW